MQNLDTNFSVAIRWLKALAWQDRFMLDQILDAEACLALHNGRETNYFSMQGQVVDTLLGESAHWRRETVQVKALLIHGPQITLKFSVQVIHKRQINFEKRVAILIINGRSIESLVLRRDQQVREARLQPVHVAKAADPILPTPYWEQKTPLYTLPCAN